MNNKLNGTIQPKGLFKQSVNRYVSAVLTKCSYPGAKDRKKEKKKVERILNKEKCNEEE